MLDWPKKMNLRREAFESRIHLSDGKKREKGGCGGIVIALFQTDQKFQHQNASSVWFQILKIFTMHATLIRSFLPGDRSKGLQKY